MSSKVIEIRRKPNKTNLPDHLYEDSTRSIGATLGSAGEIVHGLTVEEVEKFMPSLLGISQNSPSFYKSVEDYFASLSLKVDNTGLRLEIGVDKDEKPINVQDFIHYKFALANPKVAATKDLVGVASQFYIYDPKEETEKKFASLQRRKEAEREFIKVTSDSKKMLLVLTILDPFALKLDTQEQELRLDSIKESNPEKFLAVVTDKDLETRAFLEKCVSAQVIKRIGNIYLNGDEKLGNTMEETILYLKDPKNSEVLATLKARVKNFK
jgi:hypothetical protein